MSATVSVKHASSESRRIRKLTLPGARLERCGPVRMTASPAGDVLTSPAGDERTPRRNPQVCNHFEAHGPFDYDTYYCGCRGWD